MKFISFSSGSSGNCYFIGCDGPDGRNHGLLIDAGVSLRRLKSYLADLDMDFGCISGILVTHDHLDHIRHLGAYCKHLKIPVWATPELHIALARHTFTRDWIDGCRNVLSNGENLIDVFSVRYFQVPHDATQTVGFCIEHDGHRYVHITDCGHMTGEAEKICRIADTLVIESNYDLPMLLTGPYPEELRQRIRNGHGHMSNDDCAETLQRIWHPGLRYVFLCHLSENNNTPELAWSTSSEALSQVRGFDVSKTSLRCLPRRQPSPLFTL